MKSTNPLTLPPYPLLFLSQAYFIGRILEQPTDVLSSSPTSFTPVHVFRDDTCASQETTHIDLQFADCAMYKFASPKEIKR